MLNLDAVHVFFCAIRRQIGEYNDDRFVARVVAFKGLSPQEQFLVAVNELDEIAWRPRLTPLHRFAYSVKT